MKRHKERRLCENGVGWTSEVQKGFTAKGTVNVLAGLSGYVTKNVSPMRASCWLTGYAEEEIMKHNLHLLLVNFRRILVGIH